MMKKKGLLMICMLLICTTAFCQKKKDTISDTLSFNMYFTTDELYWNGEKYLINKSFLSFFKQYKKIYPTVPFVEILMANGTAGNPSNQNYYPVWILQDSLLYLRQLVFYAYRDKSGKEIPNTEQYKIMEKLTGKKFQKELYQPVSGSIPRETPLGSMPAQWVNGSFYIKKARPMDIETDEWNQWPYKKVTFKNGKLISAVTFL